jgi:hypothetical protein
MDELLNLAQGNFMQKIQALLNMGGVTNAAGIGQAIGGLGGGNLGNLGNLGGITKNYFGF